MKLFSTKKEKKNFFFLFINIYLIVVLRINKKIDSWGRLVNSGGFFLMAYLCHYIPFFLMGRTLYLHHYLPALIISYIITAIIFNFIFVNLVNYPVPPVNDNN